MINSKQFFDSIRASFGGLLQSQVDGYNCIMDYWVVSGLTDMRWLAYMLATTYHETAATIQPIREKGSSAYFIKRYWTNIKVRTQLGNLSPADAINFCGKGYVQITGRRNYFKMGKILEYDFISDPDMVMIPEIAVKIMFEGMTTGKSFGGDFTGKHLSQYFNTKVDDPVNARRIINGLDRATLISTYYYKYLAALT